MNNSVSDLRRVGYAVALIAVAALIGLMAFSRRNKQPSQSVSAYSSGKTGLDLFAGFAAAQSITVTFERRAFFDTSSLDPRRLIVMAGPRVPVSSREAEQLKSFVNKGGWLYISMHDYETQQAAEPLLALVAKDLLVKDDEAFQDGRAIQVQQEKTEGVLQAGSLEFYSPYIFEDDLCQAHALECYHREITLGSGKVIVQLGLPLFSNVMIGRGQNRHFALDLVGTHRAMTFDEYHHFASEKSMLDLLTDWRIVLPLYGSILIAVVFFLFGDLQPERLAQLKEKPIPVPDYLQLQANLARGMFKKVGEQELSWHADHLRRLFPGQEVDWRPGANTLESAKELIVIHKGLLEGRSGKLSS